MDTSPDTDAHTANARVFFNEVDRSSIVEASWRPGDSAQMIGRATRGPSAIAAVIENRGRFYTREDLPPSLPRSLRFLTRRAAKKFFCSPVTVRSSAQLVALFGTPYKARIAGSRFYPESNGNGVHRVLANHEGD